VPACAGNLPAEVTGPLVGAVSSLS